jgi:TonB family protein
MSTAQNNSRSGFAIVLTISLTLHAVLAASVVFSRGERRESRPLFISLVTRQKLGSAKKFQQAAVTASEKRSNPSPARSISSDDKSDEQGSDRIAVTRDDEHSGAPLGSPASPREIIKPTYTHRAKRKGIEGRIVLDIVIGADGRVKSARIKQSLDPGLDENALAAIRRSTFAPARNINGDAVDERRDYVYRFEITDPRP